MHLERFWSKVKKTDKCWEWVGGRNKFNYGIFSIGSKRILAHRASYTFLVNEIPKGLFVCHKCDNPPCVRPDHLFLGTAKDNSQDMVSKKRQWLQNDKRRAKIVARKIRTFIKLGDGHCRTKLTLRDCIWIIKERRKKRPMIVRKIALKYGVRQSAIYATLIGYSENARLALEQIEKALKNVGGENG